MKGCKKTSGILRYIAAWLCLFTFTLTGCNAKESVNETTTDVQTEINETSSGDTIEDSTYWENADLYTWKPETEGKWGLPEDIDVDDAVFIGDRLCYSEKGFAKFDAGESGAILVYSLTDKKSVELEFSAIEKLINDELGSYSYLYIDKFCEAPNGGLCVLAEVSDVNNNYTSFILTYNFENAELEAMRLSTDMPERNNQRHPNPALEFVAASDRHYYVRDYEGEFEGSVEKADWDLCEAEYILVIHQGQNVFTVFFEDILLETQLYNYGELGHFWVKGYENLRVMEYQIAILRDKYEYLGEKYCTEYEGKLAMLRDFPPLNYLFYPAVPEKYIVPVDNPWEVTAEALAVMQELATEAGDEKLGKMLRRYEKKPDISNAREAIYRWLLCWEKKSGKQLRSIRIEILAGNRISICMN